MNFDTWMPGKPWLSVPFATSMGFHDESETLGFVRRFLRDQNVAQGILAARFNIPWLPEVVVLGQDGEVKHEDFLVLNSTAFALGGADRLQAYSFNESTAPPSWLEVQDELDAELMLA